jgi:hypothetical protein
MNGRRRAPNPAAVDGPPGECRSSRVACLPSGRRRWPTAAVRRSVSVVGVESKDRLGSPADSSHARRLARVDARGSGPAPVEGDERPGEVVARRVDAPVQPGRPLAAWEGQSLDARHGRRRANPRSGSSPKWTPAVRRSIDPDRSSERARVAHWGPGSAWLSCLLALRLSPARPCPSMVPQIARTDRATKVLFRGV